MQILSLLLVATANFLSHNCESFVNQPNGKKSNQIERRRCSKMSGTTNEFWIYNTATKTKERFERDKRTPLKFYSCGPTVYDHAHIGNFRAFLTYDVLKRWLTYLDYEVEHICNITDVDDKIIDRMVRDEISLKDLTDKYTNLFMEDLNALNIIPAKIYPRATDHIDEIVKMIRILIEKNSAYESNGSVYFRVSASSNYGNLAKLDIEGLKEGAREGENMEKGEKLEKENARDFALWKAYKEEDGSVFWETELGKGRPGWHIECSAMAQKYLGETIDFHAGGIDLVFPHHENEIAQSEAATGKPFCQCWVHNGFVNISGEKMSKSVGNFLTLKEALHSSLDVRAFRYLVVSSLYRAPLNFTPEALSGAKNAIKRIDKSIKLLKCAQDINAIGAVDIYEDTIEAKKAIEQFEEGMMDDMNTPRASAGLFYLIKAVEKASKSGKLGTANGKLFYECLMKMDKIFGIMSEPTSSESEDEKVDKSSEFDIPSEIMELVEQRKEAKALREWDKADNLRKIIEGKGYTIKDQKRGGVDISKAI